MGILGACLPTYRPLFLHAKGQRSIPFSCRNLSWHKGRVARHDFAKMGGRNDVVNPEPNLGGIDRGLGSNDEERHRSCPEVKKPMH